MHKIIYYILYYRYKLFFFFFFFFFFLITPRIIAHVFRIHLNFDKNPIHKYTEIFTKMEDNIKGNKKYLPEIIIIL